jgi:Fur family peroxide stress response transcriptional regulator
VPVQDEEVARRIDQFTTALRSGGFRLTHQRLEVVREVASSDAHPDAEAVFTRVRGREPRISLDTVYRTLGTLADLGLLDRVSGVSAAVRYDPNTSQHHHFVCTHCGLIRDIESSDLDNLSVPDSASEFGEVQRVEVRLRGVCRECAEGKAS